MWHGIAHLYYFVCGAKKLRSLFWLCIFIRFVIPELNQSSHSDSDRYLSKVAEQLEFNMARQEFLSSLPYLNGLGNRSSVPGE
jgi:hypothetical protein